jgi:hypothetical protein
VRASRFPFMLLVLSVFAPCPAFAQEATEDPALIAARDAFTEGVSLMAARDFRGALAKFKAAGRYKMSAQVAFNVAECEVELGKLVSALGNYRLALSKADAPGTEKIAELAPTRIEALSKRIPSLTVERKGDSSARLTLDGQDVPQLGTAFPADPGEHVLVALSGDKPVATEKFTLAEAEKRVVSIDVPTPTSSDVPPVNTSDTSSVSVPGVVLLTVGGASVVVGGIAIALRQVAIGELEEACGGDSSCPPEAESSYDRGRLATGLAQVFFPVGAVSIVIGAVLMATHGPSEAPPSSNSGGAAITGFSVTSPDGRGPGVGLVGAF